jgi:hypothetical protein
MDLRVKDLAGSTRIRSKPPGGSDPATPSSSVPMRTPVGRRVDEAIGFFDRVWGRFLASSND